ncbi:MAG: twin-arginine translocase TatA/TatE family subunit [Deinococcales bacterium]
MRIGPFEYLGNFNHFSRHLAIFGPRRLPELAKSVQSVREFRKGIRDMKEISALI